MEKHMGTKFTIPLSDDNVCRKIAESSPNGNMTPSIFKVSWTKMATISRIPGEPSSNPGQHIKSSVSEQRCLMPNPSLGGRAFGVKAWLNHCGDPGCRKPEGKQFNLGRVKCC